MSVEQAANPSAAPAEPIDRARGPLTFTQDALVRLDARLPACGALNLAYALRLDGPLDHAALARAVDALIRRHEPLRTTYADVDGEPRAHVHAATPFVLATLDLTPLPEAERDARLRDLVAAHHERPFDLAAGPLMRVRLVALAPETHVLLVALHHACGDGWSLELFGRELSALYAAERTGTHAALKELRTQCLEQGAWQARWRTGSVAERRRAWWRGYLAGTPREAFVLPLDHDADERTLGADGRVTLDALRVSRQVLALDDALVAELSEQARRHGASFYMALLAAFAGLLGRWTGTREALVGALTANRPTPDSSRMLGAHYNTLLLRVPLHDDPCLAELLLRAHDHGLQAYDHQELPFDEIAAMVAAQHGLPRERLPAAMLLLDAYPLARVQLEGLRATGLHLESSRRRRVPAPGGGRVIASDLLAATPADLTFFVREDARRFSLSAFYKPTRLRDTTVAWLVAAFHELLTALATEPERLLAEVELPERPTAVHDVEERVSEAPALLPVGALSPVDALSPATQRPWL